MILQVDDSSGFDIGQRLSIGWYSDSVKGDQVTEYIIVGIKGNDIEVAETYSH